MFNVKRMVGLAVLLVIIGFAGALFTYQSFADTKKIDEEKTFDENITDIIIETDNSRIEVIPTEDSMTKVEFAGETNTGSRQRFEAEVENGVLQVKVKEKMIRFFNFDFSIKSPVTKVYLPEAEYSSLRAETGNGKIRIENISAEDLEAKSTNGEVTLLNLKTKAITMKSVNGKINANNIEGELEAKVTNGKINLEEISLDQPIHLESVNGKIDVRVDEEPKNAEVNVEVVNGRIEIFGNNNQHTVFGDGENQVRLKTVNGSIRVGH